MASLRSMKLPLDIRPPPLPLTSLPHCNRCFAFPSPHSLSSRHQTSPKYNVTSLCLSLLINVYYHHQIYITKKQKSILSAPVQTFSVPLVLHISILFCSYFAAVHQRSCSLFLLRQINSYLVLKGENTRCVAFSAQRSRRIGRTRLPFMYWCLHYSCTCIFACGKCLGVRSNLLLVNRSVFNWDCSCLFQ